MPENIRTNHTTVSQNLREPLFYPPDLHFQNRMALGLSSGRSVAQLLYKGYALDIYPGITMFPPCRLLCPC